MTTEDRKNHLKASPAGEVTPDSLMEHFRGCSLKSIILFTVVLHILVLGGSSIPFLLEEVLGPDTSAMEKEERIENAMREATNSLREIAEEYDLKPQDISDQFGSGSVPGTPPQDKEGVPENAAEASQQTTQKETGESKAGNGEDDPKSAMEKKLEIKKEGPDMPAVDDDIF